MNGTTGTGSTVALHLGRAFFAIGVVVSIALAAPAPKWEATRDALAPVVAKARETKLPIVVEPVTAASEKVAAEWQTRLSQVLASEGVKVIEREDIDPAVGVLALKATLREESNKAALYAEGARGSIASVDLPVQARWPGTTTLWALFAFVAAVGVALWRYGVKQQAKTGLDQVADDENPFALLARLLPAARELGDQLGSVDVRDVPERVEELLATYVLPLGLVRQKVIDRLGMRAGSEILVVFSYGERMLNRVVSAAADGHRAEALASYPDALAALEEAKRLAKVALETTYTAPGGTGAPSGAPVAAKDGA